MKILLFLVFCLSFPHSIFASANAQTLESSPLYYKYKSTAEYELNLLKDRSRLGSLIEWSFSASSYLSQLGKNSYTPENLRDNKVSTAWVEGVEGDGINEKITITLAPNSDKDEIWLFGIEFINGYAKSKTSWSQNNRVKKLQLTLNSSPIFILNLKDTNDPQKFRFPENLLIKPNDKIELVILEVFPGTKYQDTAISVIKPWLSVTYDLNWQELESSFNTFLENPTLQTAEKIDIMLPPGKQIATYDDKITKSLFDNLGQIEKLAQNGNPYAVRVAYAFTEFSDGEYAYWISEIVANASDKSPYEFLLGVKQRMGRQDPPCGDIAMMEYEFKGDHVKILQNRIKAIESVSDPALEKEKACSIKVIKKAMKEPPLW